MTLSMFSQYKGLYFVNLKLVCCYSDRDVFIIGTQFQSS